MSTSGGDSEYSTPNPSQRTSCILPSPTSCTSVYFSAQDLVETESQSDCTSNMDATELISKEYEPNITETQMDEINGRASVQQRAMNGHLYFSDGIRSIDFVLVYRENSSHELAESFKTKRAIFHKNLIEEGVEIEEDGIEDVPLKFVKLHAPFEVCTRYAEILKLRMPMKKIPGIMAIELNAPVVLLEVTDFFSRFFNFVRIDTKIFPPKNKHFTAIYSRNKEYLFESKKDPHSIGIEKLLAEGAYEAAYPIHEGDLSGTNRRAILYKHWASVRNFYKYQPLDHIKDYFGVKIGLYFAWLGFYTYMLIPASIVGLLCFLYAVSTINLHEPSNDICNHRLNITMCPLCDVVCNYWSLEETCFHAKFTYLVDNPATVFFACFMSFWAALFLEMWKRYTAEITHRWDLTGFDIQEEHPRPQYLARLSKVKKKTINIITGQYEPKPPFWRMRFPGVIISISTVLLLVLMAMVAVVGVILYRMSVLAALSLHGNDVVTSYAIIFTSATAALINLVCIMIFNQVYARVAEYLTELELQRTQTEFDDSLTLKIYLLQFINYYASIFYIAFVKGKLVGYPGDYNRVFGSRQEECSPGGCLLELSVQLAIIMVGKQAMNTVMEMIFPLIWKYIRLLMIPEARREAHSKWPRWAKDFRLVDFDPRGLFPEYLEMILQYGFVTIFVSSFPLAPLFAFVNNVFETRLDAKKLLTHYRRPVTQRVKDIGVWFKILDSIGKLAIITNAFIIAFTSNFIPELVYKHVISENHSLDGFLNYSLAIFNISDYSEEYKPSFETSSSICRYPEYRNPPGSPNEYKYAPIFWHILAARLAFVVVFENIVCLIMIFIKWIIPDMPYRLKEQIRREAYVTNELIVTNELMRAKGMIDIGSPEEISGQKTSPLRRQYSEPARSRSVHEVRFRSSLQDDGTRTHENHMLSIEHNIVFLL
ncbi:Anoctamin-1, partial [Armadillidium nasatum]